MKKRNIIIFTIILLILVSGCSGNRLKNNNEEPETSAPVPSPESNTLHFLGRASVRIETTDGKVIYIDPATGSMDEYKKPADLLLVTHQHSDHNKISLVTMKDNGIVLQCPKDISSGESMEAAGIQIRAVEAYNDNHSPSNCCGFILTIGDLVIYHSGDTSTTDEMTGFPQYEIDYALLCMDGYYNMGPGEAMDVAKMIGAKYIIPIHTAKTGAYSQLNMDKFTLSNKIALKPYEETVLNGN